MINQLAKKFYKRLLFTIDSLPQDIIFLIYIAATLCNYLIPYVREFLVEEVFQIPTRIPD